MTRTELLSNKVKELYESKNPSADPWIDWGYQNHVLVVADLAEKLAKTKDANVELVVAGALLHDIADAVITRNTDDHEQKSLEIAENILKKCGFDTSEIDFITQEIIKPHSCSEIMPETLDGKVLATADAMAHFTTDFYLVFCWRHYGPKDDYQSFKSWVLKKIEKDYSKKIFFDDIKQEIKPNYKALKLVFGQSENR